MASFTTNVRTHMYAQTATSCGQWEMNGNGTERKWEWDTEEKSIDAQELNLKTPWIIAIPSINGANKYVSAFPFCSYFHSRSFHLSTCPCTMIKKATST